MAKSRVWGLIGSGLVLVAACSGDDGGAGPKGATSKPCTVESNGDGTATITCPDGTTVTVNDGKPGDAGPPGEAGPPADAGTTCTIVDNNNGTKTITCSDGTQITVSSALLDYAKLTPAEKTDLDPTMVITDVKFPTDGKPVVTVKITDRKGNPVKGLDALSTGAGLTWRASVLKLGANVNGSANDTWVSYLAANATSSASAENASSTAAPTATQGMLEDKGDGTYVYTFAKVITDEPNAGTKYEADKHHRIIVLAYKSGNPFRPMDAWKDLIPQTGADVSGKNDKVNGAACLNCHSDWRAPANSAGAFHSGTRYEVNTCVACHNDQRRFSSAGAALTEPTMTAGSTPGTYKWSGSASIINGEATLNLPVFIHKIHMGHKLSLVPDRAGGGGGYAAVQFDEATYPQDVRNCAKCHNTVDQADNVKSKPSRRACGSCHDNISFDVAAPLGRKKHTGGAATTDSDCATCHGVGKILAPKHEPVAAPDTVTSGTLPTSPDGRYVMGGWQGDSSTQGYKSCTVASPCTCTAAAPCLPSANSSASWIAATGFVPTGAAKITYDVKEVKIDATTKNPSIVFKFLKDGVDVDFGTYNATTKPELLTGFVGSPSAYFAYSLPQDGIASPADFNASTSAYIKGVWNGSNSNATMTKDAATGYYTLTLTNVVLPATAKMLTGGIGYSYSMSSTRPLIQVDLPVYPYDATTKIGGLTVPSPNVWKTATGHTTRRPIVDTAKCNKCHDGLGVSPTFHSAQRNDAPTCSFCHNTNRVNGGWAVNAKDIVHAIHSGSKRTVPFSWHGEIKAWEVTYPGVLNNCGQCHVDGSYDFSASASAKAMTSLLYSTAAQGIYKSAPTAPATIGPYLSPYITADTANYGVGFATSNQTSGTRNGVACTTAAPCVCSTAAPCGAEGATLVHSPITAACASCHDSATAKKHFADNDGSFYAPRSTALAKQESCMMCHGPGKIAAIAQVHK